MKSLACKNSRFLSFPTAWDVSPGEKHQAARGKGKIKWPAVFASLRGRRKKGRDRGREKSTKEGKGKGAPAIRA